MKKLNSIKNRPVIMMTLLISLFAIISCGTDANQSKGKVSEEKVIPELDIYAAALLGDVNAINQHIKAGTDMDKPDQFGSTPLVISSIFGRTEAAIALIEGGADINKKNNEGSTPLHCAAFFCHPEIVNALLDHNADKTLEDNNGSTALESVSGSFESVKPLYDFFSKQLGPLGLKLDYSRLEKTRPVVAAMLSE